MPKQGDMKVLSEKLKDDELVPYREVTPCIAVSRFDDGQRYQIPKRGYEGDAGLDLYVSAYVGVGSHTRARIPHNIAIALPPRHYGLILPRSSTLHNLGLIVLPGVIDQGFRGEVQTVVYNPTSSGVSVNYGVSISQLLVLPLRSFDLRDMPLDELLAEFPSVRGVQGFGSTDPKRGGRG